MKDNKRELGYRIQIRQTTERFAYRAQTKCMGLTEARPGSPIFFEYKKFGDDRKGVRYKIRG